MLLIAVLSVLMIITHFMEKWVLAEGRLKETYYLAIVESILTIVFNIQLVRVNSELTPILLFAVKSVWNIGMSIKGLRRLR